MTINVAISHPFPAKGAWNSSVQPPAWWSPRNVPRCGARQRRFYVEPGAVLTTDKCIPLTKYKCILCSLQTSLVKAWLPFLAIGLFLENGETNSRTPSLLLRIPTQYLARSLLHRKQVSISALISSDNSNC